MLRYKGRVKWYNFDKGIGFATAIINGEKSEDILLHCSQFTDETAKPKQGDQIDFILTDNGKLTAENIQTVNNTEKEKQLRQLLHNTIDVMTYEQCKTLAERLSFSKEMYE